MEDGHANPNASYRAASVARQAVETARLTVARFLKVDDRAVHFTSGATESIHLALWALARLGDSSEPTRIAASPIEHKAVLSGLQELESAGLVSVTWLSVDGRGQIDLGEVTTLAERDVDAFCVMKANNEVGTVLPVEDVCSIAHAAGCRVFSDATQAIAWEAPKSSNFGADLLAVSGHKIHGPMGIGALVALNGPWHSAYGGGGSSSLRAGTPNVPAIVGLGAAVDLLVLKAPTVSQAVSARRNRMQAALCSQLDAHPNGDMESRLPNNLSVTIEGVDAELLVATVADRLAISKGSACAAGESDPSHVLTAIGLSPREIGQTIRIGLTRGTTDDDVDRALAILLHAVGMQE